MGNRRKRSDILKDADPLLTKGAPEILETILGSLSDGIAVVNRDANYVKFNDSWLRIHGYTRETEMLGKSAFQLVAPSDVERVEAHKRMTQEMDNPRGLRINLLRKGGVQFPADVAVSVVRDESNVPIGFVAITRDMAAHNRAEGELQALNRRLDQIREEERHGIGREFQDQLHQSLAAVKIALDQTSLSVPPAGRHHLSSSISEPIMETWGRKSGPDPYEMLTNREREVLNLVGGGYTNFEVARTLYIGERTVEAHRASVMRKLGLKNHTELLCYAIVRGILPARDAPVATELKHRVSNSILKSREE